MSVAEIIVRLTDQASSPGQRLKASFGGIGDAAKRISAGDGFRKMVTDLRATTEQAKQLKARLDGVEASARRIGAGLRQIGAGLKTGATTALAYEATKYGAALGFLKTQLLGTQIEFENYRAELETTLRSKEKAQRALDFASDFAFTTPFELPDTIKAMKLLIAGNLANVDNMVKLKRVLTATGDAASIMQKDFPYAIEAVRGLFAGRSEMFENLTGLNAVKKGDSWIVEYTDRQGELLKKTIDVMNREKGLYQIVQTLEDLYQGGMLRKSQTTEGMISNYMDTWTRFKKMILDAGLGDEITRQLQSGLDWIAVMTKTYKVKGPDNIWETRSPLGDLAAQISGSIQNRLREAIDSARQIYEQLKRIADLADRFANSTLGQAIGGWSGMITAALAAPFVKPAFDIAKGAFDSVAGIGRTAIEGLALYKIYRLMRKATMAPAAATSAVAAVGAGTRTAVTRASGPAVAASGARAAMSVVGKGAIAAAALYLLDTLDPGQNLWGLTKGIDDWAEKHLGFNPSRITIPKPPPMPGMFQPLLPPDTSKLPALRAKLERMNQAISDIETGKKSNAVPLETLRAARDAVKQQVDQMEAQLKRIQGMMVTPNIDTSSLDAAIGKAQQFLGYMRQIGPVTPNGGAAAPAAPAPAASGGGARGGVNVTVHLHGNADAAGARRVAAVVREAIDRTYGDGAYRPTMVG